MARLKDYVTFYKLAKNRGKSDSDYLRFENFQARIVIGALKNKGINFSGKSVLDIGGGRGGYSLEFFNDGANAVMLDMTEERFQNIKHVRFVLGDALRLPFKPESFDFVFCSSLIEHVKNPQLLIEEIKRVLKKNGICYLSFPPFWSPVGAHQFKPFHYLGEKAAVRLAGKFYNVRSHRYDDEYGKLHKRTIGEVRKYILNSKLKIKSVSTRMSPVNFAKIPLLKEFLTWHAEFLIQKP